MNPLIEKMAAKHKVDPSGLGVKFARASTEYNAKSMMATAVANTAAIDLTDEVVVPSGAERGPKDEIAYFGAMKAIYLNHDYVVMPIGTMVNAELRHGGWVVQFKLHGKTQESRDVAALYSLGEENPIRGTSIGFIRKSHGKPTEEEREQYGPAEYITREWKWIELSVTAQPCNPEAMMVGISDDAIRSLEGLVKKSFIARHTAGLLGMPEPRRIVTVPRDTRTLTLRA